MSPGLCALPSPPGVALPGLSAPRKDSLGKLRLTWAKGRIMASLWARMRVLPGPGGEEEGREGLRCPVSSPGGGPRGWRDCFFQSVAPDSVWRMTRGENQDNRVRIAQAQEKGHKDEQCGACSAGRDGIWGWAAGQASGSRSLEVHGDPGLRPRREERGPGPRGGQTQRDRGRGRPEKRGCSLRKGLPV